VNSCLALAVAHQDAEIITIEGLADNENLHPLQQSFIEHDAFQCGYCTPGQICSAVGMLREVEAGWPSAVSVDLNAEHVTLSEDEIRERMSGNLCRCAAYANIVPAIAEVLTIRSPDAEHRSVSGVYPERSEWVGDPNKEGER
jgi:xanthine dehydrogenase YagT iron-sulfur-binding subunit